MGEIHSINASKDEWNEWKELAAKEGKSLSAFVRWGMGEVSRYLRVHEQNENSEPPAEAQPEQETEVRKPHERTLEQEMAGAARVRAARSQPNFYAEPSVKQSQADLEEYERSWNQQIRDAGGNPFG